MLIYQLDHPLAYVFLDDAVFLALIATALNFRNTTYLLVYVNAGHTFILFINSILLLLAPTLLLRVRRLANVPTTSEFV